MKSTLIIGSSGQLGQAMQKELTARGAPFVALDENEIDLNLPDRIVLDLTEIGVVFNCAAYTNVDGAEADEETATRVNGEAVSVLAAQCRAAGVPLVHYSTDYVFDGSGSDPIPVNAPRKPLNAYGRSKARGEEALEASNADYLLVRTSWVYAPWGNNFESWTISVAVQPMR